MRLSLETVWPRGWRVLLLLAVWLFLLLLSYGFPVTGDDWFFTTRAQNTTLSDAIKQGIATARQHYMTTNGRLLGNFLSGMLGCLKLLRELVRCAILLGVFAGVCRVCKIRKLYGALTALALTIALPAEVFAQSYAWAAGFFNYVPPVLLLLVYLHTASRQIMGEDGGSFSLLSCAAYLLLGILTQLFVENVTVGACLLSGAVCVSLRVRRGRFDGRLAGHFAGALLGAAVMFLAPGYRNIGQEGYREMAGSMAGLLAIMEENFPLITRTLLEDNWLLIAPLSALCGFLLCRAKPASRRAAGARRAGLALLALAPVFFYCNQKILLEMAYNRHVLRFSLALDVVFALGYLCALVIALRVGVGDSAVRTRSLLFLRAAALFVLPLLFVQPIGPRCLYLPHMLLVCVLLCIGRACLQPAPQAERTLRWPLALASCAILCSILWIMFWNGRTQDIRSAYIERQMAQGATQITLPGYPYAQYVHEGESQKMGQYYYYDSPDDITFSFVPYGQWDAED